MIRGLQITMRGEELRSRIGQRIGMHEATINTLDMRIGRRENDLTLDVRRDDGFKSVGELEIERQHYRDRVLCLRLLRDSIVAEEVYALDRLDLRQAELISSDRHGSEMAAAAGHRTDAVIDGLKLTMPGDELRRLLEQRLEEHQRLAERWKHESRRAPEQVTEDDEPLLPEEMCTNEAERHTWRAGVLCFIRDHIDSAEVYRLAEADLAFGELLPEKPWAVAQDEYDTRTSMKCYRERHASDRP